jgi:hypothetical protein
VDPVQTYSFHPFFKGWYNKSCSTGLGFFHYQHFPAFVGSTGLAGMVGKLGGAALGAFHGIHRFYFLVGAPFISSRFGRFVFWYCHK